MTEPISCVVLAAGKGTRMKSTRAKVLHEVFFAPMIHHVLEAVNSQGFDHIFVVVGHRSLPFAVPADPVIQRGPF